MHIFSPVTLKFFDIGILSSHPKYETFFSHFEFKQIQSTNYKNARLSPDLERILREGAIKKRRAITNTKK